MESTPEGNSGAKAEEGDVQPTSQQETTANGGPTVTDESDEVKERTMNEEAMSEYLISRCPNKNCQIPYFKEAGCNNMVCAVCQTNFCHLCHQELTDPCKTDHFGKGKPCQLATDQ